MKTKLMALEALNLCCECSGIFYSTKLTVARAAIAALEADIAKGVEHVAFLFLPGLDGEEFSDDFQVEIVAKEAEKLQEALVQFSDQDGVTIPLYTTPQEPAAAGWMPIETAPEEGTEAIVSWIEDGVQQYLLECFEDGVWLCHSHSYEHYCMVASAGMTGPKEMPPYTHWMIRPAAPGGAA